MTQRAELLGSTGCANHEAARALLQAAVARIAPATEIEEIEASDPDVAARLRFPGLPTIRVDGADVEPGFAHPRDHTPRCRLYRTDAGLGGLPDPTWIEEALRR